MSAIYAIITAAKADDLNAAFVAMQYGPDVFSQRLTTDDPATTGSSVTHLGMYNAAANPADYSAYSAAKAGTALPMDINGDPVAWGEFGNISEADALAAFAELELWANNSAENPATFAEGRRQALGLSLVPDEV